MATQREIMRKVRCTRGKIGPFNPAIPIAGDRLCLHQHGSTQTVDLVEQIGGVTNFHDGHSPDERRPILNLRRRTCRPSRVVKHKQTTR